jgi:hypothetical protein
MGERVPHTGLNEDPERDRDHALTRDRVLRAESPSAPGSVL